MKKLLGILGTCIIITLFSLNPSFISKATESQPEIVDTEELPELLTYEDFCQLYTLKEEVRYDDPNIIQLTTEEADMLMRLAQIEAGENDPLAIAYVMKVVMNRVESDDFPDTVKEVLYQKEKGICQFGTVYTPEFKQTVPNVNAHYALYLLESGQINIEALYFEATWVKDSWQSRHREVEFEYAGHRFYK